MRLSSETDMATNRPVSVAVKGPSSGGKSFVVEKVLQFFPERAYYAYTAMSEKALVYDEEPLKHRMLALYEASGIGGEQSSYFIRSLLSEGRLLYKTVVLTEQGPNPDELSLAVLDQHGLRNRLINVSTDHRPDDLVRVRGLLESIGLDTVALT